MHAIRCCKQGGDHDVAHVKSSKERVSLTIGGVARETRGTDLYVLKQHAPDIAVRSIA